MSWPDLLDLIAAEVGQEAAARIAARARLEMGGLRITIGARVPIDPQVIEAAAPGRPRKAAKILGIDPSTAYRALRRPIVR